MVIFHQNNCLFNRNFVEVLSLERCKRLEDACKKRFSWFSDKSPKVQKVGIRREQKNLEKHSSSSFGLPFALTSLRVARGCDSVATTTSLLSTSRRQKSATVTFGSHGFSSSEGKVQLASRASRPSLRSVVLLQEDLAPFFSPLDGGMGRVGSDGRALRGREGG